MSDDKDVNLFATDLIAYCSELKYEEGGHKDPDAMDVSALQKEADAALERSWYRDNGYDTDYTSGENRGEEDWEAQVAKIRADAEAHISWLGNGAGGRKGKGKGKGGGGGGYKGKGKGGRCNWCDGEDHFKKDCPLLLKYKKDKDEERKRKGMPPFVPRSRNGKGINDLDYGSRENVEYEGMLRPSAGSLGVGSLDLMALDCENGCGCEAIICGVCTEEKFFDDGDSDDCISVADVEMDQMHAEALQDWEDDKICLDVVGIRGFRTPTAKIQILISSLNFYF